MALIFLGKSQCAVCNNILQKGEEVWGFAAFIPNVKDKLYLFNDAGCHKSCIDNHRYGKEVIDFSNEFHLNFKQKKCCAKGNVITKMEDFFALPLPTSDRLEPLFKYNFQ